MNKIFLCGNLTRDVELKRTSSDKTFGRVGIAVKRPFTRDKDAVDFLNLLAWEKTAEFMHKYFGKGSRILVEGRVQTGSYEKDGVKINTFDVIVENVEFAGGKRKDDTPRDAFNGEPLPDDYDIPL